MSASCVRNGEKKEKMACVSICSCRHGGSFPVNMHAEEAKVQSRIEIKPYNDYESSDIAAMNQLIAEHKELGFGIHEGGSGIPDDWADAVSWDNSVPRPIIGLNLDRMGLKGTLDVRNFPYLEEMHCFDNELTELLISGLDRLKKIYSAHNYLDGLDVSGLDSLWYLDCYHNQIDHLDVSGAASLRELYCQTNQMNSLNVTGLNYLERLHCDENDLTELHLSTLTGLKILYCYENELTNLDLSGLTVLENVYCYRNYLQTLELGGLNNLEILYCSENNLSGLDVGELVNLSQLLCENNRLEELDVSGLSELEELRCHNNPIRKFTSPDGTVTLSVTQGDEQCFKRWMLFPGREDLDQINVRSETITFTLDGNVAVWPVFK